MQAVLGVQLVGIYLSGSLALGDFNPDSSDLDLIVVTEETVTETQLVALRQMHTDFSTSDSPWAQKLEVIYITRAALQKAIPDTTLFPQFEKERGLFLEALEDGWLAQCYIVREHGVALVGPAPKTLIPSVDLEAMRRGVAKIAEMWQADSQSEEWLEWLRLRANQAFVVLTLCRLLYTLETGKVASKPAAARWAQEQLGEGWAPLIADVLDLPINDMAQISPSTERKTLALIHYTAQQFDQWQHKITDLPRNSPYNSPCTKSESSP